MSIDLSFLQKVTPELLGRYNRPGPRYTSYPTAPEWSDFGHADYEQKLADAEARGADEPLSVYVHLPFCVEMCTFCGCNVIVTKNRDKADVYLGYVEREIAAVASRLPKRRKVSQLHWGGGTPTFLTLKQIERLMKALRGAFEIVPDAEVALEIDPCVTSKEQIDLLRSLGFNRISMGVQDFTPKVQEAVNRIQGADLTADLLSHARKLGFTGINLDLIYGLPFQDLQNFGQTLKTVLEMKPDRLAVFSFAHVPWLKPHQRKIKEEWLPSTDLKFGLFKLAMQTFLGAGYKQIGMDHFACEDDELARAQSKRRLHRNFQGYTAKAADDTISFGMTGIGDLAGAYVQNEHVLSHYYAALDAGKLAVQKGCRLSKDDEIRRVAINSVMCNFYLDFDRVKERFGVGREYFERELSELRPMEEDGFVTLHPNAVEVLPLGRVFVRNVAMIFDAYLRKEKPEKKPIFSKTV